MFLILLSVIVAYILGSIPTAYIFGKLLKKIDIREFGSGNVGATNVFRTVGKIPGIIVLVIDFLKGFCAVTLIPLYLNKIAPDLTAGTNKNLLILLGSAAIAGHIWTIFLKFKGGKGVATTAGVLAGVAPLIILSALLVWIIVFVPFRYVSLASIVAAVSLPILAVLFSRPISIVLFCSVLCIIGVFSHRSNIKRLLQGSEKKII